MFIKLSPAMMPAEKSPSAPDTHELRARPGSLPFLSFRGITLLMRPLKLESGAFSVNLRRFPPWPSR